MHGTGRVTAPASNELPVAALANIRNVDLRSTILADTKVPAQLRAALRTCTACGMDNPEYTDVTGDGVADVTVPIYDDEDQVGTVAYSVQHGKVTLIFAHYGHQATTDVHVPTGDGATQIVLTNWMYAAGDERCCPSGRPWVRAYAWKGGRLVLVDSNTPDKGTHTYDADDQVVLP